MSNPPGGVPGVAYRAERIFMDQQDRRRGTLIVLLMVALSTMSYFDRIIMSIAGPGILHEFSLSETQLGAIYSAFTLCYAFLMIPCGRGADRFGPRLMLTAMAVSSGILTALTSLGGKPGLGAWLGVAPSFLVIRFILGATSAPIYPACARMSANWKAPSERAHTWGWIAAGTGIGGALAPLLFPSLIAAYGWRIAFCLAGAATLLLGVLWCLSARDYPSGGLSQNMSNGSHAIGPWWGLLRNRNLLLLSISYAAANYFEYILFYWPYYYFSQVRHTSLADTASYTTAIWVSWAIMTPLGGWITDLLGIRFGRSFSLRIVPVVALTCSAVLLFFGVRLSNPLEAATLMCFALGLAAATEGPYWTAAAEVGGRQVGAASATVNTGGNAGGFLGPLLTPAIASWIGWERGLYAGCLVALGGVITCLTISLRPDPAAPTQEPA
jgi:sugar phosphate permease